MKKFLLGLLVGFVLAGMTAVIVFFASLRLSEPPPSVPGTALLEVRPHGEVKEREPVTLPLIEPKPSPAVFEYRELLQRAAGDKRIRAVLLRPQGLEAGWGKMAEIRTAIERFRKSGKPVYAYLESPGTRDYYISTAANRIYMPPEDTLNLKGLRIEALYLAGSLDKLGVEVQIEHAGKYKDAGDIVTRSSMSETTREVLNSVLDGLFADLLQAIGEGRKKTADEVRAAIDEGPFMADDAFSKGLVDGLLYEDEVTAEIKKELKVKDLGRVSDQDYLRAVGDGGRGKERVALLVAEGNILRRNPGGLDTDAVIASNQFRRTVRKVRDDESIKAVLLRIDSPGGDAFASDEILRELKLLSQKKPMVISMSDVAASGGYYMAMTGDPVVAYPTTITGSIGVVFGKANLHGLYDKLGVKKEILKRGRFAAIDSDYVALDQTGLDKLQRGIDKTYERFVTIVAEARKRKYDQIEPLSQGRVWLGSQAKERGLLDELGGLDTALTLLRKKAGIDDKEEIRLVLFPAEKSLFERIFESSQAAVRTLPFAKEAMEAKEAMALEGSILRRLPFELEIH